MSSDLFSLSPHELLAGSVWEFDFANDHDLSVSPVTRLPVNTLANRLVATRVHLANGDKAIAVLGNLDLLRPELNEHFITASIFGAGGQRFELARYHDPGWEQHGPQALSEFLALPVSDIFPIRYDLTGVIRGAESVVHGTIQLEPSVRLSRAELISYAVP